MKTSTTKNKQKNYIFKKEMKKMRMIIMMIKIMKQNKLQPFSTLEALHVNDKPYL
jgi:hypothetical protein